MNKDSVILVWEKDTGRAYISSQENGSEYQDWGNDKKYLTILLAVQAAKESGIPVTHRAISECGGHVGYPLRA